MKRLASVVLVSLLSFHCLAETPPPAYQRAAADSAIPVDILWAVAKVESNFKIKIGIYPWPWTLNIAGKSMYFRTRAEACTATLAGLEQHGKYGVDIGLTQQNWGWVGKDFYSHPCDALDPNDNLRTASIRLKQCYAEHGNWVMAAGCYHHPAGGEPAKLYRAEIRKKLASFGSSLLAND